MKIYKDIDLYKYNTMRLHSIAKVMYIPESLEELIIIIKELRDLNIDFHILAAGSKIIFSDEVVTPIINVMFFARDVEYMGSNEIQCGASVRIQSLISKLKTYSLGGIEYLASVPSSVGGAVFMNAGRGRKMNLSISDYIHSVDYLDLSDMEIKTLLGNEQFSYRVSPFQKMNVVILRVRFRFKSQSAIETSALVKERLLYSKKVLSADKPSCGSVFCHVNPFIIRMFMGAKCGGAIFSKKTPNWISNINGATAKNIETLVNRVIKISKLFLCKYRVEIRFMK